MQPRDCVHVPSQHMSQPTRGRNKDPPRGHSTTKGKGQADTQPPTTLSKPSGSGPQAPTDPLPSGWGDCRIHYNTDSESDQEDLGAHKAMYGCIMKLGAPNFEIQAAMPDELAQEDNDASD